MRLRWRKPRSSLCRLCARDLNVGAVCRYAPVAVYRYTCRIHFPLQVARVSASILACRRYTRSRWRRGHSPPDTLSSIVSATALSCNRSRARLTRTGSKQSVRVIDGKVSSCTGGAPRIIRALSAELRKIRTPRACPGKLVGSKVAISCAHLTVGKITALARSASVHVRVVVGTPFDGVSETRSCLQGVRHFSFTSRTRVHGKPVQDPSIRRWRLSHNSQPSPKL